MAYSGDGADLLNPPEGDPRAGFVREVMLASPERVAALAAVRRLGLPDCWIAAGFVRSAVWDALHAFETATPVDDIDVIYFDRVHATVDDDRSAEWELSRLLPGFPWSVRNQARMHERNHDRPYRSSSDAMLHWLETPTAIGVALTDENEIRILAPFGLDDLLDMVIRPTPHARAHRTEAFRHRLAAKPWLKQWPRARLVDAPCAARA